MWKGSATHTADTQVQRDIPEGGDGRREKLGLAARPNKVHHSLPEPTSFVIDQLYADWCRAVAAYHTVTTGWWMRLPAITFDRITCGRQ